MSSTPTKVFADIKPQAASRLPTARSSNKRSRGIAVRNKTVGRESDPVSVRARLIATARLLFYREGIRAVGIDRVLAESGVSKMSLYRHFGSKDELVLACLTEHEREYWELWDSSVCTISMKPVEALRSAIRFIARRTAEPSYQGCIFLNTAQTFPEEDHPAHQAAVFHKQTLVSRLHRLCKSAGSSDPRLLSYQLVLLINGAQATAGMLGRDPQLSIVEAADALLKAQGIRIPSHR
jgi:AcrR family transcriptional regulator